LVQEVETLMQRDAALQKEFLDLVPPSHPHHPALLKIFRRRIKRTKKASSAPHIDHGDCAIHVWLIQALLTWRLVCDRAEGRRR
jgi:hypothetical protein